ncbi:MAG: lipopolysaccharide biosynthesis protein, partial [Chroococcidiopsis sp.]
MKTVSASVRWVLAGRGATAATLQTLLTKILILAANTCTGAITARILGPDGRGEQAAIALWPQFLAFSMTLGLPIALRYYLKRNPEQESEIFSATLVLGTILGIVAAIAGILFIPQWLTQYSPEVIRYAQWFMVLSPIIMLTTIYTAALEADYNFKTANQAQYLQPLTTLVILTGLAVSANLTPFTAVIAYAFPSLPIFFWLSRCVWQRFRPRLSGLRKSYQRLVSYGLRAYGIDLIGTLSVQVDQALVINLLAPEAMGKYVISLSLSRMLNLFQHSIVTVLLPKTAARPIAEVVAVTGMAVRISTALTTMAATILFIVGPMLLNLLYGTEFMGAVPVFRILVVMTVVDGSVWILAQAFMALGRPGTVTLLQTIGLGLSIPFLLLLVPRLGLQGAGWALLCSTVVRLVFVLACY